MTYATASQQVSWLAVHDFVLPKLRKAVDWPMLGSPAWRALADRDPVKWAAVLDGGQHWALRVEHFQQANCEASHELSAAEDWTKLANVIKGRADYFAARPWMDRRSGR